jgi:hypothetical protein
MEHGGTAVLFFCVLWYNDKKEGDHPMQPLFENHAAFTRENYLEAARKTFSRPYRIFCFTAAIVFLALAAVFFYLGDWVTPIVLCLGAAFLLVLCFAGYRLVGGRQYRQILVANANATPERTTRFFEDRIEITSGNGAQSSWPYEQLVRILETEHLLLLMLPMRVMILLDKRGFTLGDEAGLRSFLARRCPGLHP